MSLPKYNDGGSTEGRGSGEKKGSGRVGRGWGWHGQKGHSIMSSTGRDPLYLGWE